MTEPAAQTAHQSSADPRTAADQPWRRILPGIGGVASVVAVTVVWALINFGSLRHAWLYAGGTRVTIEPATMLLRGGKEGESREGIFLIRNLTDQTVGVVGVTASCACLSTDKLPIKLPPKGSKELHVALQIDRSSTGSTVQSVVYHTDHPAAPNVAVTVTVR